MGLQLIKILLNYSLFNKYAEHVEHLYQDNKELLTLFRAVCRLHEKYPDRDIDLAEFSLSVLINCPDKDKEVLSELLKQLADVDLSSIVLDDLLNEVVKRHMAYELALAALDVSEGKQDFETIMSMVNNMGEVQFSTECTTEFVTNDLEELYNEQVVQQGLRWRLNTLNRMLGSLRTGDFGFIFARPETGKTTFLASEITKFAEQVDRPILWFNNEEQGSKVQLRLYQAMLGIPQEVLFSDIPGNRKRYMELGGSNIKIYDSASIHRKQVEQIMRELQPSLAIFDQLDKVKGFTDDREDLRLGSIYIWARELAKQYCPVIAVCQADASGEGKRWLTMDNVANAKTAKQAEADWILGIGKTHSDAEEYMRHLHLSKNKLPGDQDTDPTLRHGKCSVSINPEIARYEDL